MSTSLPTGERARGVLRTGRRILHVLPDLAIGGGQTIVLNHVRRHDRRSYDLILVAHLFPRADLRQAFLDAGARVIDLAHRPGPLGVGTTLTRLVRTVRREEVDLIHVHSDVDRKLGHLVGLLTGTPVVGHLHAEWVHLGPKIPEGAGRLRRLRGSVAGHARDALERWSVDHYIAESRDVARIFEPLVSPPISVLNQAVPTDRFDGASDRAAAMGLRGSLGLLGSAPVLINVSRMVPGKGHLRLLELMPSVFDRHPDATLLLVGDGELRPDVESAVRALGMSDRVRVLGNRNDVPELLSVSDLFVFASESEGFGLVALEAMAAGLPVVAFRLPALEEFVEEGLTGYLVDLDARATFSETVRRLLSDPDHRAHLGIAGREVVQRRFPPDAVARSFEDVYQTVLSHAARERV